MNILVTGGMGFIGRRLCERLLKEDHKLYIVDNFLNRDEGGMFDFSGKVFFYGFDVNDRAFMATLEGLGIDTIFHLAANSDIKNTDPYVDFWNTFSTTYTVLEGMRRFDIKNIIFASTSAIYGDAGENIHEDFGPLQPISHYGAAKLASEAWISSYSYQYNINAWICRFPNVTGPNTTHGIIHDFKKKLAINPVLEVIGDGTQLKPYIYVEDLVDAILFIWRNAKERLNVYNIGAPDQITVKEIAEMMSDNLTYTGESWRGDVLEYDYDTTKLSNLGWTNTRTSKEAIKLSL